jgi:competence protein ComEA
MSTAQRRAILTLLALILAGHGVRSWWLSPGQAPGSVSLLQSASAEDLAAHRTTSAVAGRPLRAGEKLDLNTADAAALTRLPGVGAGLAKRIVGDREARGPFRTLADLDRVPGIGPALLRGVAAFVTQGAGPPGSSPGTASPQAPGRGNSAPLDLNSAGEAELLRLPGIGPTKARAIVAYRQARGPFASVGDLGKVPGIGPATLTGLAGLVTVR